MSWVAKWVAKCDLCGHEWLAKDPEKYGDPKQCARCKSRRWNGEKRQKETASVGVDRSEATIPSTRDRDFEAVADGDIANLRGKSREWGSKSSGGQEVNRHDPRTCRVYRCSQCMAEGKKF